MICRRLVVALTLVTVLCACGASSEREAATASAGDRRFLSIGTAPPGGAFFVIGGALAEVLNSFSGQDGWQVTAEATKGTKENIRRLGAGELDLGLANAAITYFAIRGEAEWDRPQEVRTVMTLGPNVAMFLSLEGSGIETIGDLAGKRVTVGPSGAGFADFLTPILDAHGVSFDDFTALNATQAAAVGMLADGSADAVYLGGVVPTASVTQAATSQDVFFVPYEEAAMEALTTDYPLLFRRITLPAGTYRGMEEDFHGLVVGALHLIASVDTDEEVVYTVTRTLYESREQVIERHGIGRSITAQNAPRDTGTPFHPGAIRFYREAGIWPEEAAPE
jgi:TRAP transporter TAXI family solute receptor